MTRKGHRALALAAGLLACVWVGRASAEDVWVKSYKAEIRSGKGAVFPVLATAAQGTQLSVIAREPKGWIKVKGRDEKGNDVEGYVYETSISAGKVEPDKNLLREMGAGSGVQVSNASKGLNEAAEKYAATKRLDPHAMDSLIAFRKAISPSEWAAFTAEGKVGPDAP